MTDHDSGNAAAPVPDTDPADAADAGLQLRMVSNIALSVTVVAAVAATAIVLLIRHDPGGTYAQIVHANSLTRDSLGPALTFCGLVLLAAASFLTWAIARYASFLIAGPLFRFSRNLESAIEKGPTRMLGIREGDLLQDESRLLIESVEALGGHYAEIRTLSERAAGLLAAGRPHAPPELVQTLARLKARIHRVRL